MTRQGFSDAGRWRVEAMVAILLLLEIVGICAMANGVLARPCNETACQLPNCLCSTTGVPGGLDPSTLPQIVMLSFDDALTALLYDSYYSGLFNFTNPNKCPIGITYFLSHDYTDYSLVHDVWSRGHEIASHSITHSTPTTYWLNLDYQGWIDEMNGEREIASSLANIPEADIVGSRAPFLQIGGDTMFQALNDSGFWYDCSMPTRMYTKPPLWPYTMDYKSIQDCQITPCPVDAYPGFWEVPLVDYNDTSGIPCAMLDTCPSPTTENDTYRFLLGNFLQHYERNRAPFGVFTHASWFQTDPSHYPGYMDFIRHINSMPDVYIVTVSKALAWIQQPTLLADILEFQPWACNGQQRQSDCRNPQTCYYPTTATPGGGERYMKVCTSCPPNYPWLGNPYGY